MEGDEFKILLLFYSTFQIIKITMILFEFLCLILYSNSYVFYVRMFMLLFLFMKFCTVKHVYSGHAIERTPGNRGHFFNEPTESRKKMHVIIQHISLL